MWGQDMRNWVLAAITAYQRHLSPHKGWCCAYHAHTGRATCSQLGYRAVRRYGVVDGIGILRMRLAECGAVYRAHRPVTVPPPRPMRWQRGDCDLPCDFDLPSGGGLGRCSGALDCVPGHCDWPTRRDAPRRRRKPGGQRLRP
jgi:putative component of membrane protein insertase Oxa1/YidC/SpoIIIJ protein YidD